MHPLLVMVADQVMAGAALPVVEAQLRALEVVQAVVLVLAVLGNRAARLRGVVAVVVAVAVAALLLLHPRGLWPHHLPEYLE
jgi:uncharacterized membrane protein (UPF0182 family)